MEIVGLTYLLLDIKSPIEPTLFSILFVEHYLVTLTDGVPFHFHLIMREIGDW